MPDILNRLGREVLVIDGAMGTMLHREGVGPEQNHEQLSVTNPEMIAQIHNYYVQAGADCVSTNTFGGSRPKLSVYGLGDRVAELNRAAVRLAKRSPNKRRPLPPRPRTPSCSRPSPTSRKCDARSWPAVR
jgi:methionine synthase I (cobalamin-dependent)